MLIIEFSQDEIRKAVWECEETKSPRPDGFNFVFFKECWDIVKGDLERVVADFYMNGKLNKGCNSSFIVLILEKRHKLRP